MRKTVLPRPTTAMRVTALPILFWCLLLGGFCLTRNAFAQDATGSLEGQVADTSGAVVRGAVVTLKNLETNAVRTQASDTDGLYRFPQLSVGTYIQTVDAPSFAHFT
jgi:Carboxypeptidase regulatory-like domain